MQAAQDGDVIQIEDSATYEHTSALTISGGGTPRLVIQAANRQRPCLRFSGGGLAVTGPIEALRLNGLLLSGGEIEISNASVLKLLELVACTLDPIANPVSLIAREGSLPPTPVAQISLCRCVTGGLQLGGGVAEVVVADSIIDRRGGIAIGDLLGNEAHARAHLERTTVWGQGLLHQLYGSECLFVDQFLVGDQQDGCLRYSRYQVGSELPRRFQCVSTDAAFNSRRLGRPSYGQLHLVSPAAVRSGAEDGAEMGAFHGALASLREKNLGVKVDEYLPVSLSPALIYVT